MARTFGMVKPIDPPKEPPTPKRAWQMGYAEVRRTLLDMNQQARRPLIEDLYGDVVSTVIRPEVPPVHFLRLWQEWNHNPDCIADMVVPDMAPRYIAAVLEAEAAGEPVPKDVLRAVRERPEYTAVKKMREAALARGEDLTIGKPVGMAAVSAFIKKAARSTDSEIAREAKALLAVMNVAMGYEAAADDAHPTPGARP